MKDVFNKMKEGEIMCQALREFFADELNEALEKRTIQVTKQVTERVTEQNKKDIISNGLKKGFDVKLICELVGVSAEMVEAVKQEMLETV